MKLVVLTTRRKPFL